MMRIAQVAPLYESVPPKLYGGTERVVSHLTEALVALGHDVTLFASGDSQTSATLVPICPQALRLNPQVVDPIAHHVLLIEKVAQRAEEFDIIHFHVDHLHYPLMRRIERPFVTTLHGRQDIGDLVPLYLEFADMPVVSISNAQRAPVPWLNWVGTVHHGMEVNLLPFSDDDGGYLAFLGRISPEKGVDRAIEIARRAAMPLRIAAKVDRADQEYFESEILPLLSDPGVEFIGEIGDHEKGEFLGNARALLFPINWPEPFGLVMMESLACGTPVVAFRCGSVPEVIDHGVTGFIVTSIDEAVEAIERIGELSRQKCRQVFEERFSAERMARDYLAIYRCQIARMTTPSRVRLAPATLGALAGD